MHGELATWLASCGLVSLRIVPVLLFAPPFSLIRVPRLFVAMLAFGLAAALVAAMPAQARLAEVDAAVLVAGGLQALVVGLVPVVVLQLMFASLYLVGRTIDMQAGYGLALLIDPTTRGQIPLVGTMFAYAAGATFFAMDGHHHLLRFFAASLRAVPLDEAHRLAGIAPLASYASTVSIVAFGVGGAAVAALLLCDLVIAMLSRTVPQMNALIIGIQVKAAAMLIIVPIALGLSGALLTHLVASALEAMPRLL